MNVAHRAVHFEPDELVVLSAELRLYAALSSGGDSVHVVQPARLDDARVGDGKVIAGELVCSCPGGQYARICWAQKLAIAFERGAVPDYSEEDITWLRQAAPGEVVEALGR